MKKAYKIYLTREKGQDSRAVVWEYEKQFFNPKDINDKKFIPGDSEWLPYSKEVLADFMIEVFHFCDGFEFPILVVTDEEDNIREIYETFIDEVEEDGEITGIHNWTDHTRFWDTDDEYRYFKGV